MNSLIFFLIVIGIDIFLKSIRDKKKIEKARQNKMQELRKMDNDKPFKEPEKGKREINKNPTISQKIKEDKQKKEKKSFFGEGESYKKDYQGYRDRYEKRYDKMDQKYEDISDSYKDYEEIRDSYKKIEQHGEREGLYDENAISIRKKQYKDLDEQESVKTSEKIDIPVPKASSFKSDLLNGIIFSEILDKPKSMKR
ncbi:MAG: hypothetical protein ACTHW2_03575 [Tissierella sp.]|uniref:hypothetical protein n=1 Tax=Tissierella sp. TaxID=41274 RepID=UPI003F9CA003